MQRPEKIRFFSEGGEKIRSYSIVRVKTGKDQGLARVKAGNDKGFARVKAGKTSALPGLRPEKLSLAWAGKYSSLVRVGQPLSSSLPPSLSNYSRKL